MMGPYKAVGNTKPIVPFIFFKKAPRAHFSQCGDCQHTCPSGEIGRHSGLKIRRLPEKGRTGSIPVSGTNPLFYPVSYHLKTRMFPSIAGFLLCYAVSGSSMR